MTEWFWRFWPLSRLAAVLDERDILRQIQRVRLKQLTIDELTGWEMTLSHDIVPIIGGALVKAFEDHGGANFVEFRCNTELGPMTLTLQRLNGKTPAELLGEAKAEIARLQISTAANQEIANGD